MLNGHIYDSETTPFFFLESFPVHEKNSIYGLVIFHHLTSG